MADDSDPDLYRQLMGYPDDLPDLTKCDVPENSKPEGIDQSYLSRRLRGELPDVYIY